LAGAWEPLGPRAGWVLNLLMVLVLVLPVILVFVLFGRVYPRILAWTLAHKAIGLAPAALVVVLGGLVWQGAGPATQWMPTWLRSSPPVVAFVHAFPGLGTEFMPALDEGSFLYMPTTMPHASIGEALDVVAKLDRAILSVPEVSSAVGKIGRVESALDPADLSMVETVIDYLPEYVEDEDGRLVRQWRDHIESPQDIWNEIVAVAQVPGTTSAPKLQPIETRQVMLQTGFRAPMGVKVFGPDLETIDRFALALEQELARVPSVQPAAVFAERVVGKPYLEIDIDRERIARHGISIADVQDVIEVAIGGMPLTTTIEGRERYNVRVRYVRERRDQLETLGDILVPTMDGAQIPMRELAEIRYRRGPQMIKTENTFLVAYVIFDRLPGYSEVQVVDHARAALESAIEEGRLVVPAGVSYQFAGSYENQVRATQRLRLVLPLSLAMIVVLLYLQFRSLTITAMVFSGVFVAWGGGFLMLWFYAQPWFLDTAWAGLDLRDLLRVQPFYLSVAVWVGFLALFGIATDDGVVMATRIRQAFAERVPADVGEIRAATVEGARQRIRAALMTSATTILALMPVLTSTGRGSDVMVPMAIPTFGGMTVALLTLFVVPILYSWREERKLGRARR
jgi:copper/silver efflux system protein